MLTFDQALRKASSLYGDLEKQRRVAEELDDYYEGKQPLTFASAEWADFHKNRYAGFADNWCGVVADAVSERLGIEHISIGDAHQEAAGILWGDWLRNDMESQSSQGFLESIVAKRSAVIVWGDDDGEPVVTWEHPGQVFVEYAADNPRQRTAAIKAWTDGSLEFLTLYEPAAVWKFQRPTTQVKVTSGVTANGLTVVGRSTRTFETGSEWSPRQPAGDDSWPLPNPLGEVPVVEFLNRPRLGRDPISDVAGTKAMQDAINLLWAFLFGAADQASLPGRVIMGQEAPKIPILDKEGQVVGKRDVDMKELAHGRFLWLTGANTKVDQFTAADLSVFTDVIEIGVGHVGAQTRTPAHYFVANKGLSNLNGETLTATETPLVKKVEEFQLFTSGSARDVFRLMAKVRDMGAVAGLITTASPRWKGAAIRGEAQLTDALSKRRGMGYPLEYILEHDGIVDPNERARIMAMYRAEHSDPTLERLGRELAGSPAADGG